MSERSPASQPPPAKKFKAEPHEEQTLVSKTETEQNTSNSSTSPPKRVTFPCRYCDRVFKKIESRDKHETTHKDFLAYDCGYCYKTFKSDEILKEHMKIHIEQTKFPCTFKNCSEVFSDRRSLREHKGTHEPEEFICEIESCGRIFSSQKSLKSHKSYTKHYTTEKEEDEDEIECDICLSKFDRNDEQKLAEHLRMHI
jgi:KRAB domain-containing zinc finger protein